MKKTLSLILAFILAAGLCACAASSDSSRVTSSDGLERYAKWLGEKLGGERTVFVGNASDAARYGIDADSLDAEGFVIRSFGDETVVIGADEKGVDRGVHDLASHADVIGYERTYNAKYRVKKIVLAGYDISEYSIVIPTDADANTVFAAETLRDYTEKACAAVLPIVTGDTAHMIKFVKDETGAHGDEGFTISTTDGQAVITHGIFRGAANAAMTFLEKYEGWRFVLVPYKGAWHDGNVIDYLYESDLVDIPAGIEDTESPEIKVRNVYGGLFSGAKDLVRLKYDGENIDGSAKYGGYNLVRKACHGLSQSGMFPDFDDYIKENKCQPCFTDPETIDTIIERFCDRTERQLASGARIGYELTTVDVAHYDCVSFCSCKRCRALFNKEHTHAAEMLTMANAVAEVYKEKYPGIYVTILAYSGANPPPVRILPLDNVAISYCFYLSVDGMRHACGKHCLSGDGCYPGGGNNEFAKEFERWCEIATYVDVWTYGEFYNPAVSTPSVALTRDNIKYLRDHGAQGIFDLCSNGEMFTGLEQYMAARMLWDCDVTDAEFNAMINEYFRIVYGDAAGDAIYGYYVLWERAGRIGDCCSALNASPWSKLDPAYFAEHYAEMTEYFDEAKANAQTFADMEFFEKAQREMDFMGIGSVWESWHDKGTAEQKAFVAERYNILYDLAMKYPYQLHNDPNTFFPEEGMDFDISPFEYQKPKKK